MFADVKQSLRIVYIMDREVVPRSCKICDWLLNPSQSHFGLHQGKNVIVTMEFEVRKRHVIRSTLATDMVQWVFAMGEAKMVL